MKQFWILFVLASAMSSAMETADKPAAEPGLSFVKKFYFFNIVNPEEFRTGAKPSLAEVGPYAYQVTRRKADVFEVNGDLEQYGLYNEYHFDESRSCQGCSKTDPVYVLNAPMAMFLSFYAKIPDSATVEDLFYTFFPGEAFPPEFDVIKDVVVKEVTSPILEKALSGENPDCPNCQDDIVNKVPVDELLFAGYKNGMANTLIQIAEFFAPLVGVDIEEILNSMLPDRYSGGYFGFFKGRNATKLNSYYTINNGRFDQNKNGQIYEMNGAQKLPETWWPDAAPTPSAQKSGLAGICKNIYGTDGTIFSNFVKKEARQWIYDPEMCRSFWIDFDTETEINAVGAYRYRPPASVLDMKNPINYCYCPEFQSCATANEANDVWDSTLCYDQCSDGTLRVSNCYDQIPLVMSWPHFYNGDATFLEDVDGLNPDQDLHDSLFDIEPETGKAIAYNKRIQMNMRVEPWQDVSVSQDLPNVSLLPIFWSDEEAITVEENLEQLRTQMIGQPQAED